MKVHDRQLVFGSIIAAHPIFSGICLVAIASGATLFAGGTLEDIGTVGFPVALVVFALMFYDCRSLPKTVCTVTLTDKFLEVEKGGALHRFDLNNVRYGFGRMIWVRHYWYTRIGPCSRAMLFNLPDAALSWQGVRLAVLGEDSQRVLEILESAGAIREDPSSGHSVLRILLLSGVFSVSTIASGVLLKQIGGASNSLANWTALYTGAAAVGITREVISASSGTVRKTLITHVVLGTCFATGMTYVFRPLASMQSIVAACVVIGLLGVTWVAFMIAAK